MAIKYESISDKNFKQYLNNRKLDEMQALLNETLLDSKLTYKQKQEREQLIYEAWSEKNQEEENRKKQEEIIKKEEEKRKKEQERIEAGKERQRKNKEEKRNRTPEQYTDQELISQYKLLNQNINRMVVASSKRKNEKGIESSKKDIESYNMMKSKVKLIQIEMKKRDLHIKEDEKSKPKTKKERQKIEAIYMRNKKGYTVEQWTSEIDYLDKKIAFYEEKLTKSESLKPDYVSQISQKLDLCRLNRDTAQDKFGKLKIKVEEQEKQEKLRQEQEKQEKLRQEQEKQEKLRQEQEKQEKLRQEQEEQEKLRQEQEKQEKLRQEQEKQEKLRQEQEKQEKLKQEQALRELKEFEQQTEQDLREFMSNIKQEDNKKNVQNQNMPAVKKESKLNKFFGKVKNITKKFMVAITTTALAMGTAVLANVSKNNENVQEQKDTKTTISDTIEPGIESVTTSKTHENSEGEHIKETIINDNRVIEPIYETNNINEKDKFRNDLYVSEAAREKERLQNENIKIKKAVNELKLGDTFELEKGIKYSENSQGKGEHGEIGVTSIRPAGKYEVNGIAILNGNNEIVTYAYNEPELNVKEFIKDKSEKDKLAFHIAQINEKGRNDTGWIKQEDMIKILLNNKNKERQNEENTIEE